MKKLESVKSEMFVLKNTTSKTIVGGMYTSYDVETCLKLGKKVQDKTYDTI